jgi:hypothetical protein
MKIAVFQFYTSNVVYGPYSETINEKYCNEKGYTYICEKDNSKINTIAEDRSLHWGKVKLVQEVLNTNNFDYVLFLDADAIISDFNQRIEDFIDDRYDMIFAEDIGHHSSMNTGVFLSKNSEWTKNFFNTWWESGATFKGKDTQDLSIMEENLEKVGYFKQALWHEQTCITLLYRNDDDIKNHIKVISNRSFNHREYNEGNFIFHAYAYGHEHYRTINIIYKEKFESTVNNKEKINLIVYHVYCVGNYLEIVTQQLNRLKTSGLYNWCDKLEITCINTSGNFNDVEELVKDLDKVNLNKFTANSYEYEGINKVWEYSQKYCGKLLYFHTKGVSNTYTTLENLQESPRKKKGISWWKETMEHFLIDNYQECLQKLDKYDQCGLTNNDKWWWGNFWWANLSFINLNSKPFGGDRWYFEAWLNHYRNPSVYEFYHFDFNAYYTSLPSDIYNKEKYKDSIIEVISAYYGTLGEQQDEGRRLVERKVIDVTDVIKKNLEANGNRGFNIRIDNNLGGDPYYGIEKMIEIFFTIDGDEYIIAANENRNLKFLLQHE